MKGVWLGRLDLNQRMRSSKPRAFTAWRHPNIDSAYRLCPRTHRIFKYVLYRTKACFLKNEALQSLLLSGVCGTAPRRRYFGFEPKPLRMSGVCAAKRAIMPAVAHNDTDSICLLFRIKPFDRQQKQRKLPLQMLRIKTPSTGTPPVPSGGRHTDKKFATSLSGWCHRKESNLQHKDFQSSALPTELQWHVEFF